MGDADIQAHLENVGRVQIEWALAGQRKLIAAWQPFTQPRSVHPSRTILSSNAYTSNSPLEHWCRESLVNARYRSVGRRYNMPYILPR